MFPSAANSEMSVRRVHKRSSRRQAWLLVACLGRFAVWQWQRCSHLGIPSTHSLLSLRTFSFLTACSGRSNCADAAPLKYSGSPQPKHQHLFCSLFSFSNSVKVNFLLHMHPFCHPPIHLNLPSFAASSSCYCCAHHGHRCLPTAN